MADTFDDPVVTDLARLGGFKSGATTVDTDLDDGIAQYGAFDQHSGSSRTVSGAIAQQPNNVISGIACRVAL